MGALQSVSQVEGLWAASSYEAESHEGIGAYFTVEEIFPLFLTYRGNGFPVRCVQELTLFVVIFMLNKTIEVIYKLGVLQAVVCDRVIL